MSEEDLRRRIEAIERWKDKFEEDRQRHRENLSRELGSIQENIVTRRLQLFDLQETVKTLKKEVQHVSDRFTVAVASVFGGTAVISALVAGGYMIWQIWTSGP